MSDTAQLEFRATAEERARFWRDGFAICRGFDDNSTCLRLQNAAERELFEITEPIEYESVLGYPGAPRSANADGGKTPRRLLKALDRSPEFVSWACSTRVGSLLKYLFDARDIYLSQNHHNCVMTKHPVYSSETGWHRDIRYWHFSEPNLITAWLALDDENQDNGGLSLIPGSHRLEIETARFDDAQFLRPDVEANQRMFSSKISVDLKPGDLLLFHCNTLHSAGWNRTHSIKRSLVFTYHTSAIHPIEDTRSARLPPLKVR